MYTKKKKKKKKIHLVVYKILHTFFFPMNQIFLNV